MEHNWLRELLKAMQNDISEIKDDVKSLQRSKWMFDGAREAVRIVVTVGVTLLTMWMSHK